jgi:CheY-like chemotaxis protein
MSPQQASIGGNGLVHPSALAAASEFQVPIKARPHKTMVITVLVIEENETHRLAIQRLFETASRAQPGVFRFVVVAAAETPTAALSYLQRAERSSALEPQLDLLLIGTQSVAQVEPLLPTLRRCLAPHEPLVVLLTSNDDCPLVHRGVHGGSVSYLPKPIRAGGVRNLLEQCLRRGVSRDLEAPQRVHRSCGACDPGPRAPGICKLNAGPRPGNLSARASSESRGSKRSGVGLDGALRMGRSPRAVHTRPDSPRSRLSNSTRASTSSGTEDHETLETETGPRRIVGS